MRAADVRIASYNVENLRHWVGRTGNDVRRTSSTADMSQTLRPPAIRLIGRNRSPASLLLSHCKLEGVQLRGNLTQAEGDTDPLSFRDLMWLCFLPNERLDDKNLLFENVTMKHLKLRQVVDVVFDIHDDHSVELGRRIRAVEADLVAARNAYRVAEQLVEEQQLGDRSELEALHRNAKHELSECALAVAALDARARADTTFAEDLRSATGWRRTRPAAPPCRSATGRRRWSG